MNIHNVEFIKSAANPGAFLRDGRPNIVFSGKSNVGKSSVINCLVQRKNLARTGQKPGKTVNVNLYRTGEGWMFADLPGYGFAKVSKEEKARWGELMGQYFDRCGQDMALGVLVFDIRRDPTEEDRQMLSLFSRLGVPCVLCANKADKLTKTELAQAPGRLKAAFGADMEEIFVFSAVSGAGRAELVRRILAVGDAK
jgi:GTP-binding protein